MLEEPQLNGRIASVINKLTNSAGWQAREELRGALRGPKTKPDVLYPRRWSSHRARNRVPARVNRCRRLHEEHRARA